MLFVEDVLIKIANRIAFGSYNYEGLLQGDWYMSFVMSIHQRIRDGSALSTEQGRIVIKLIKNVRHLLVSSGDVDEEALDRLLETPNYRLLPYQSISVKREVRFIGDNLVGFRFKYNELIRQELRGLADQDTDEVYFDRVHKIWVVPVTAKNLPKIKMLITAHRFELDSLTQHYLDGAEQGQHSPTVCSLDAETDFIVVNVCNNPILTNWIKHVVEGEYI